MYFDPTSLSRCTFKCGANNAETRKTIAARLIIDALMVYKSA